MRIITTGNIIVQSGEFVSGASGRKFFKRAGDTSKKNAVRNNVAMLRALSDGSPESKEALKSLDKIDPDKNKKTHDGSRILGFFDKLSNANQQLNQPTAQPVTQAPPPQKESGFFAWLNNLFK